MVGGRQVSSRRQVAFTALLPLFAPSLAGGINTIQSLEHLLAHNVGAQTDLGGHVLLPRLLVMMDISLASQWIRQAYINSNVAHPLSDP
jgi:hypothetical protein